MWNYFLFYKILTALNKVSAYKTQQFLSSACCYVEVPVNPMFINFFDSVYVIKEFLISFFRNENSFIDYSKSFQKSGSMKASCQGSEILNEFLIKLA